MTRRIVLLLLATLVVGVAPARAAVVDGGTLTAGVFRTVSLSADDAVVDYTMTNAGARRFTLDTRDSTWGANAWVIAIAPNGSGLFAVTCPAGSACRLEGGRAGVWHFEVHRKTPTAGSLRMAYAYDQNQGFLNDGDHVSNAVNYRGQQVIYSLAGVYGDIWTIDLTASHWTSGALDLNVLSYTPDIRAAQCVEITAGARCRFRLPRTQTFYAVVSNGSTGTYSFDIHRRS